MGGRSAGGTTLRGRHYRSGLPIEICSSNGRITSVQLLESGDDHLPFIAPAWCEIQINGGLGISFNAPTLTTDQVHRLIAEYRRRGIGECLPTLVTQSFEAIRHGLATIRRACHETETTRRTIVGIHLEGPYLSPIDGPRGAHPLAHIRRPDWDEFCRWQEAAEGTIRLVTLAPEVDGALGFIEKLATSGVVVAIGHTAASGEQLEAAVRAGARLSTHLGNGAHAVLPRHDHYIWQQLAHDGLLASIITDGHHLPVSVVKAVIRVKGPSNVIIISDAGNLAGLPPGRYAGWDGDLEVSASGKIVIPGTPYLAGSARFTDECVGWLLRQGLVSRADTIDMAGAVPRRLLGLPERTLAVGEPAEFVVGAATSSGDIEFRPQMT